MRKNNYDNLPCTVMAGLCCIFFLGKSGNLAQFYPTDDLKCIIPATCTTMYLCKEDIIGLIKKSMKTSKWEMEN